MNIFSGEHIEISGAVRQCHDRPLRDLEMTKLPVKKQAVGHQVAGFVVRSDE
jgi:hypothetical protein